MKNLTVATHIVEHEYQQPIPTPYLAGDVLVGEADDQTVLVGVVLVLVLLHQTKAGTVVGLALTAATVLDL